MPKKITSPIKRFEGSVTIADPLTLPQAQAIENAMGILNTPLTAGADGRIWLTVTDAMKAPAVLACVEKWELKGLPEHLDFFPASPRADSHKLLEWLWGEIFNIYIGEAEVPNE